MVSLAQFISSTDGVQRNAAPFVFGALAHLFCFRVGDWDLQTTKLLVAFLATQGLLALSFSFLAGLYASLLTYRAAFHRLNRFPGPFAARLSNFYITRRSVKNFQLFQEVQDLHKQYGDIVRIGPSELSIADPSFFHHIHANSSPFVKGPWYNILHPVVSLQLVRDKKEHSRRRKTWDKGFGSKALHDYEPRVVKYTDQLLSQIKQTEGKPINVSTWFNFYSFDNKPEIPDAFSGILNDYETLEKPTKQDMVNLVGDAHLIVVAGSDTTAASLTCLFYNLARNPQVTAQLQADLDAYHAEHAQADHLSLSKLPYLQACIDESLRLYPPVPSGVQRMSPPEGQQVGDVFIPGNTVVQLGLMELRFVTSQILRTYDVGFAKDFDPSTFPAGLQDTFTLATSKLDLVFTRRKEVANP
ncbi:Elongation factor 1-beta [Verticillium dahliae VDG1]|nr:Elongation factor 1-beta [Verticillium dahliae VDG1]